MSDFEKQIHTMFDHIWDCDVNHPIFEDTVGELMNAVIQCYNNLPSAQPEPLTKTIEEILDYLNTTLHPIVSPDNWNVYSKLYDMVSKLPSVEPEIIRCKDCKHWQEGTVFAHCDKLYGMGVLDAYDCMRAEDDFCSYAERREGGEE